MGAIVTFDSLPEAITQLTNEVGEIKRMLLEKSNELQPEPDRWFDLSELCNYLPDKPAKATVYGMVARRMIPYHKPNKKLVFLKSEIDSWIKSYRSKTVAEIAMETEEYLINKKRG